MVGFYASYKAVFDAVKTALTYVAAVPPEGEDPGSPASGVESLKTVVLGEQFSVGALPKAIINAEPSRIGQATMGELLDVRVGFSVVLVIREYTPKNWFTDIISVMSDVVDAVLADRTLTGKVRDVTPTMFSPGEIRFQDVKDKLFYGGVIHFEAVLHFEP
jgi:hypothetical protein